MAAATRPAAPETGRAEGARARTGPAANPALCDVVFSAAHVEDFLKCPAENSDPLQRLPSIAGCDRRQHVKVPKLFWRQLLRRN